MAAHSRRDRSDGDLSGYFRTVGRHRVVDREHERELVQGSAGGSGDARDRLILANLAFVIKVAREYRGFGVPFEDLISEGTVGLIEAADRFDSAHGTKFVSYATWWVRKRILEALSERSYVVRIPASRQRRMRSILEVQTRLTTELGRRPTREELARDTGESPETIERALLLPRQRAGVAPTGDDGQPIDAVEVLAERDSISALEQLLEREDVTVVREALEALDPRAMTVIALRFGLGGEEPATLREAGERLELSRERIRQIEGHAARRIRRLIRRKSRPRR